MTRTVLLVVIATAALVGAAFADEASLKKHLEKYKGQTVTQITITGNKSTKEYVIRREIQLVVGEPATLEAAWESVTGLLNLDIFSEIVVTAKEDSGGVAVNFDVHEMPPLIPYFKFKYNEENGWSIGPAVTAFNLAGRDIKLSGYVLFGGTTTYSIVGSYPWITGNHVSLDLDLVHLNRDDTLNEFEEKSYQFTPWLGTFIGKSGRLKGSIGWFQMGSDSTGRTLDPDNTDDFAYAAGAIGYDTRDSWTNAHRGWNNQLQIGYFGGSGDWWEAIIDLRRYQQLFRWNTLAMGTLFSLNSGTVDVDFPEYFMYRMGGANSIRGYLLDDLGPVLYGQNQAILTAEYQWEIMPWQAYKVIKWSFRAGLQLAAFVDYGTAWNNGQSTDGRWKFGYGVGIRPMLPAVNVVRFDMGVSQYGDIVFNFGVQTKFDAQRLRLR